jgi:hypothetical protein
MKIEVTYKNRDLIFKSPEGSGSGLDKLISFIGANKNKISQINISGESNSYTFLRQVYLMANLIREISAITFIINADKIKPNQITLPVYHQ